MENAKNQEIKFKLNPENTPVLFSDVINVVVNNDTLYINFGQGIPGANEAQIVSRIALSKNQAKGFIELLNKTMTMSEGNLQTGKVARA